MTVSFANFGLTCAYCVNSSLIPTIIALDTILSGLSNPCITLTSASIIPDASSQNMCDFFHTKEKKSLRNGFLYFGIISCFILAIVPTVYKSAIPGSLTCESLCVTRYISSSAAILASTAFTDFFLLTSKCITIPGKTVTFLNGIAG